MSMMTDFEAKVVADSVSPEAVRIITFEVTFPRFILAEVNTHRMLSRNSASSRAIPPEQQIARVRRNMFVPLTFNKRVKGMGVGEALTDHDQRRAHDVWVNAGMAATYVAETLLELDVDKSRVNRILEPFLWHTAVVTGTEWENFFALRTDEGAQPEFRVIADMMQDAMEASSPQELDDEWHTPYVSDDEYTDIGEENAKNVSVRRCAAISYAKHAEGEELLMSLDKVKSLASSGHVSPFEHVCRPLTEPDLIAKQNKLLCPPYVYPRPEVTWCGNVRGWWQMRKDVPNEENFRRAKDALALG